MPGINPRPTLEPSFSAACEAVPFIQRPRQEIREPGLEPGGDRLGFGVVLHDFLAHFAAPTGLFVATERPRGVTVIMGIDANCARPDLAAIM